MSELVLLHHNEPMTTSLAIAACTESEHDSVILLVRKYVNELEEFGEVSFQTAKPGNSRFEIGNSVFEIENCRSKKGRQTEFAFLNEQQSTLLVTFMRNSPVVIEFKKALVRAFFAMRDRLRDQAPQFTTRQLDHGADLAVAADRTFRSFLRSARSAGMKLPQALRCANKQTVARTGMDMLAELAVDPDEPVVRGARQILSASDDPVYGALALWFETAGDGPWRMAEILRLAMGVDVHHPRYSQLKSRAAAILRGFGLTSKKMRVQGIQPLNYWSRPHA